MILLVGCPAHAVVLQEYEVERIHVTSDYEDFHACESRYVDGRNSRLLAKEGCPTSAVVVEVSTPIQEAQGFIVHSSDAIPPQIPHPGSSA